MTLHVTTETSSTMGVVVLSLQGTPAEELLELLADGVAAITNSGQSVVLDLDELILSKASVVGTFLTHLLDRSPVDKVVFSCGRLTGRKILRRWGGDRLRIVSGLHEALPHQRPADLAAV